MELLTDINAWLHGSAAPVAFIKLGALADIGIASIAGAYASLQHYDDWHPQYLMMIMV